MNYNNSDGLTEVSFAQGNDFLGVDGYLKAAYDETTSIVIYFTFYQLLLLVLYLLL